MSKDRTEEILESVEKRAFFGKSGRDEVAAYVVDENERQRAAGLIDDEVTDKIDLSAAPVPELKKGHKRFVAGAIVVGAVILIVAIAFCIKLAG